MDRDKLTKIAERMARAVGVANITRTALCYEAGFPEGSFRHVIGESFIEFISSLDFDGVPATRKRVPPILRRQALLESAMIVAQRDGWQGMRREAIAELSNVSAGLVTHRLGGMQDVKREVLLEAIKREVVPIIAEGVEVSDPEALTISKKLRAKVNKYIAGL